MSDWNIVDAVNNGLVTVKRTKKCDWCGSSVEERIISFKEDKEYYPQFFQSGWGVVCVVPHEISAIKRREINLCPKCAEELDIYLREKEEHHPPAPERAERRRKPCIESWS